MISIDTSVVLCVRNGQTYLREALDSVAAQGEYFQEVIVIDDGSTDRSVEIAAAHACRPRIVSQGALGHPAALNRGVAETRGAAVAFIDCDDVWPAARMAVLGKAMAADPLTDGVFGQIANTDAALVPRGEPFHARLLTSGVIRRDLFERVGPFRTDIRHASNVDWISRASAAGARFRAVDIIALMRRIHGDNMGIVDVTKGRADMLRVIRDHHARTRR